MGAPTKSNNISNLGCWPLGSVKLMCNIRQWTAVEFARLWEGKTAKSEKVPHDEFNEGFAVGYQLIKGTMVVVPGGPRLTRVDPNSTPFLMGIKAGLSAAGHNIVPK